MKVQKISYRTLLRRPKIPVADYTTLEEVPEIEVADEHRCRFLGLVRLYFV
jgi:hypothetical protein